MKRNKMKRNKIKKMIKKMTRKTLIFNWNPYCSIKRKFPFNKDSLNDVSSLINYFIKPNSIWFIDIYR